MMDCFSSRLLSTTEVLVLALLPFLMAAAAVAFALGSSPSESLLALRSEEEGLEAESTLAAAAAAALVSIFCEANLDRLLAPDDVAASGLPLSSPPYLSSFLLKSFRSFFMASFSSAVFLDLRTWLIFSSRAACLASSTFCSASSSLR